MGMQIRASYHPNACVPPALPIPSTALRSLYSSSLSPFIQTSSSRRINLQRLSPGSSSFGSKITRTRHGAVASSNVSAPLWDSWKPDSTTPASAPSFSDIFWPSAGAFAAMAIFGKMDQILAPKGISMTIAPLRSCCCYSICHSFIPWCSEVQYVHGPDRLRSHWCYCFLVIWAQLAS
ncbi:hypothetical protein OIU74_016699 [Salix koriyanagi]|uniref:Uncharacterized protein n=1 Tax=Salix koriyanagi TaxID=2511006 RepID=A0A9Q0PH27_9ROSI|nr:hypothetical protein OIU74_016699 [Salix koriyanagi]